MTALRNQRGSAMIAALSIALLLLPLGALVALQCRTDLSIQQNLRRAVETFYVAEAGLAHALAEIPPGRSFDQILAGPDHVGGTNDDGTFPFVNGPPPAFPYPPFRYDVQVISTGGNVLRVVSHADGVNGTAKVVEALVTRSPLPFTPAALYAEANEIDVHLGSSFRLSGFDHQAVFPPAPPSSPAAPIPAMSVSRADGEAALRAQLVDASPGQISGAGAPPSVATVEPLDVGAYATGLAGAAAATIQGAGLVDDATWGTADAPQLSIVPGNLSVRGRLAGTGVLVIDGSFEVSGTVEFCGLILVQGAIVFAPASTATVVGTLWQGASQDDRLELGGTGIVAYSSSALADSDRVFPGLLPHAAALAGWQEDF